MRWIAKYGWLSWAWRCVAAVAVVLALVGVQAASAAGSSSATIIVFAPGAAPGSLVNVEWLDMSIGVWLPVSGWTGTLYQTTGSGVPYQAFAVLPANYGQGPFRWVIYNPSSKTAAANNTTTGNASAANVTAPAIDVWGSSSTFMLPNTDGATLEITVLSAEVLKATNNVVGVNGLSSAGAASPAVATMGTIIAPLNCPIDGCNAGAITGSFSGLPATSWITVEWLDGNGAWQPVLGWQGQADFIDASGHLVKQFGVYRQNYGQGPFRWAVYNAQTGGSLLAVSPNFNLPTADGQNEILNLAG